MTKLYPILFFSLVFASSVSMPSLAEEKCGPDFRLDDPRYLPKLATKKSALRAQGYPPELVDLMDRDGACVARVERVPDAFSIKTVKGETQLTLAWTKDDERVARDNLKAKEIDAFFKFNVARVFPCCAEPQPHERPDWNADLELNTSLAIRCVLVGDEVVCS